MKLLVVDDHALVREGVKHVLLSMEDGVQVLEAGSAEEALRVVEDHADLDLVLLDVGLPGMNGFELLQVLRERGPAPRVAMLSASDDKSGVMTALQGGAAGFIPKAFSRDLMIQAVRFVLAGGIYVPPQAIGVDPAPATPDSARHLKLTDRQMQVLGLLARGKSNKAIASALSISEPTVKAHVTEVLRVLKVTNRAEAAIAARRLGFH
ncbi:MAG TPA: response regulator transcription factor [Burkholderiales bacterium]|nr:response regulator transcription factor [Burkholderiales bacterium]